MNVEELEATLRDIVRTEDESVGDLAVCLQSLNERVKTLEDEGEKK